MTTSHPDGSRVAGWALNAQAYDLTISWIPGKKNVVADCLSLAAKSDAKVLEKGASGENERSIVERLEDTLVGVAFTTAHHHHVSNIQRYWRGYSIRKYNIGLVLTPYQRVARSSLAQCN